MTLLTMTSPLSNTFFISNHIEHTCFLTKFFKSNNFSSPTTKSIKKVPKITSETVYTTKYLKCPQ